MPSQPQVKYRGPHARLVIDGIVLERAGEPVMLSAEQLERIRDRDIEVLDGEQQRSEYDES